MTIGIYQIYNRANGNQYIGSSVNAERRLRKHLNTLRLGKHSNEILQRAWGKHSKQSFSFHLVEECEQGNLLKIEQWYLDNTPNLYNIAKDSTVPMLGRRHTEETKRGMSEKHKGHPGWNTGMKGVYGGWHHTEETIRKLTGIKHAHFSYTDEQKKRRSIQMTGKQNSLGSHHTDEWKKNMNVLLTGRKMPEEQVRRLIGNKYALGRHQSDEEKRKHSVAMTGKQNALGSHWIVSPEGRKNNSNAHKGKKLSKEHCLNISIGGKGKPSKLKGRPWGKERKERARLLRETKAERIL